MSRLKVGLVGCGRIARLVHLDILRRLPGVDLVALAEPDPQRREQACRLVPSAAAFSDYRQVLATSEVEAIVICLPNALHAGAAVAALTHGKHVYLEKPLATSLEEARKVLAAWRRNGVIGMIGFNYRFNALYGATRGQIQSGRLGEVVSARSVFSTASRAQPAWRQTRRAGGGVLLELACHHIDLIRFFFGQEVSEVSAGIRSQFSESDSAMLQLRLANGLPVQSFFSTAAVEEDRFEIYGRAGKLTVDRHLSLAVQISNPTLRLARLSSLWRSLRTVIRSPYLLEKLRAPAYEPSYRLALAHFVMAARNNRRASPDLSDGYRSLAVIEAAEESARTGRVVSVPDFADEDLAR